MANIIKHFRQITKKAIAAASEQSIKSTKRGNKKLNEIIQETVDKYSDYPEQELEQSFQIFGERIGTNMEKAKKKNLDKQVIKESKNQCGIIFICQPPSEETEENLEDENN